MTKFISVLDVRQLEIHHSVYIGHGTCVKVKHMKPEHNKHMFRSEGGLLAYFAIAMARKLVPSVADLGFVAWGGGTENFQGAPRISKCAKFTNLVD